MGRRGSHTSGDDVQLSALWPVDCEAAAAASAGLECCAAQQVAVIHLVARPARVIITTVGRTQTTGSRLGQLSNTKLLFCAQPSSWNKQQEAAD